MFTEKNLLLPLNTKLHDHSRAASRKAAFALTFFVRETLEHRTLSPSMFLFSTILMQSIKPRPLPIAHISNSRSTAVPNFHDVEVLLLQTCI